MTIKNQPFTTGQRIKLKKSKQCFVSGQTTIVTVLPEFMLTYVKDNPKHCYFKVSYNGKFGNLVAKNGDEIKISRVSMENLKFEKVKEIIN